MLVAGHDDKRGGQLFALDMLGSCIRVPYAVHGFGGLLSMGILDRYHNDSKLILHFVTTARKFGDS